MIVRLTEVVTTHELARKGINTDSKREFTLREVYVNPDQVVCLREDERMARLLLEGTLPAGLDSRQGFTRIHMNRGNTGLDIVVVGHPDNIEEKIFSSERQLLKG
jgi:hypothetical protein